MEQLRLPPLRGAHIHLVGAKGTGMAALAEILAARGALLSGSDVADQFYTDAILAHIGLIPQVGFAPEHLPGNTDLVLYSPAYSLEKNPELQEAARRGLPMINYPEALGALSREVAASGDIDPSIERKEEDRAGFAASIAGVHGKTTTAAMTGVLVDALAMPATVLAGSAVANFGGRCTLIRGERHFIAETCEYRRHFMHFSPAYILLTAVESDHQDFYPSFEAILQAFVEFVLTLPPAGTLIFCADDAGAREAAQKACAIRPDIRAIAYGFEAQGLWKIKNYSMGEGESRFQLAISDTVFSLHVPGKHLVLNATGALALVATMLADDKGSMDCHKAALALAAFRGSMRRSEIVGEAAGILFMDDYGHHPTAIATTIAGIKAFYPGRRLVVDFMSHTYSRTDALFDGFVASLDQADALVLHKIYASAREQKICGLSGRRIFDAARARRGALSAVDLDAAMTPSKLGTHERAATLSALKAAGRGWILYTEEPEDAAPALAELLRTGDIFLTMGAGDNWKLGKALYASISRNEKELP